MAFYQDPPRLENQYRDDRVLSSYLRRALGDTVLGEIEPELDEMGELAGGWLHEIQAEDRLREPELVPWDPWGKRVDRIEVTPLWKEAARLAARMGVVATAYERRHGALSRIHQFALAYLFDPSTDVYTCPLAMTDGAAKTLSVHRNAALIGHAIPRLTSRDPARAWTSGQWMTERTGGSDVGLSETLARRAEPGARGPLPGVELWRLTGTKWFTSSVNSPIALALARPEGNPEGGRGLALFYVELDAPDGERNGVVIHRLKDKLGTRKLPTGEIELLGALAVPVAGLSEGVKSISPMLNITRTWNAVCAAAGMRRGLALVRDYSRRRFQFGSNLSEKPLHLDTLAGLAAEFEAAFHLAFRTVELIGREEAGAASEEEHRLLRLLTPVAKLTTARQAVAVTSEVVEAFGGAGYVEDTGVPRLLRDAQTLPIWEGATNVLSLESLKAIHKEQALEPWVAELRRLAGAAREERLVRAGSAAVRAAERAAGWLASRAHDLALVEAGARRFALTLGRAWELALLVRHAQWSLEAEGDERSLFAALRFLAHGVDLVRDEDLAASAALGMDSPAETGREVVNTKGKEE